MSFPHPSTGRSLRITAVVRILAMIAVAALSLSIGGCRPDRPVIAVESPRADLVSVHQLAGELGLRMGRVGRYSASMSDSLNTLLILGPPESSILLNNRRIGNGSGVVASAGRLLIHRTLADQIRFSLRRPPRPSPVVPIVTPARPLPRATVVLDAGHGGKDPGAPNKYGPVEKILVLDTVGRIGRILQQRGVHVIFTRDSDTFVELEDRATIANQANADLFVSIHADALPAKPGIDGFTVYVSRQASAASTKLGKQIIRAMKTPCDSCRGLRKQDFRVLVKTDMPAVLIELGYLTNRVEAVKLGTAGYRQQLAAAIANGIASHLGE